MRIAKILLIVGIALFLFVVGAAVVLMSMDFNQYKPEIAAEVKEATGRDMTIDGDLKLNLLTLSPGLEVDGVKFANAAWGSRPEMAIIKRFEVKVSLLPLLSGTLDVDRVVIEGADILIERNKQGEGNYDFTAAGGKAADGGAKPADKPAGDTTDSTGSGGDSLPAVAVRGIAIEDSRVTYKDAASGQALVLGVEKLAVSAGPGDPLKIDMKGSYNGDAFTVNGEMGELAELLKPTKPWPLAIKVSAGGATIDAKGKIANPAAASGIDIALSVKGDDLSKMSKFAGGPVPPLGPYALAARVTGAADKAIALDGLKATMGKSDLSGKATVSLQGKPAITAALSSDLLDLDDFTKPATGGDTSAPSSGGAPESGAGGGGKSASGKDDKRLFPDDPLPVDGLKAANAAIDLSVKKLIANKVAVENFKTVVALRNADLSVAPISGDVAKGKIDGAVHLRASQGTPTLAVKLDSGKIDIGQLLTELDVTDLLYGVIDADIDVQGRGQSVRQIMAGLNGKTSIVMGEGKMKSTALDTYVGGAATVLTQLLVGKKSEYTVVNCFLNQFDIKNGVATSKVMLFDTEYAQITGKGTINLGTEKIDYTVDSDAKSVTVSAGVPVDIGGTLAEPTFNLNPLATAAKIGGLVGTVFFPPAAIVTLGNLGVGDDNACIKQASGQKTADTESSNPVKGVVKGIEKSLDEGVKKRLDEGLKKLFGK